MHTLFNKLYHNFDNHVNINGLMSIRPKISKFIANNFSHLKPVLYDSRGHLSNNKLYGILEIQEQFINNPDIFQNKDIIQECIDNNIFSNYIIFENDNVIEGSYNLILRDPYSMNEKQFSHSCRVNPIDKDFHFFYSWLDEQNIFSDYGRVNFFVNPKGSKTELHKDIEFENNWETNDHFVLFNFFDRKKLFLYNNTTNEKHYMQGKCLWFVGANFHGSDPVSNSTYSLRVDGVFTKDFLHKIGRG